MESHGQMSGSEQIFPPMQPYPSPMPNGPIQFSYYDQMLIQSAFLQVHHPWLPSVALHNKPNTSKIFSTAFSSCQTSLFLRPEARRGVGCSARRRVRYEEDEEDEDYGQNLEIAMLESYSESSRSEALLLRAIVDGEEELVLIFKGFSSCLSARTATDPSKGVLPARAIIKSIDVVKGPFDPSNIVYLEKDLTWEAFKIRLQSL